jgi:hypothetical protein
VDQAGADAGPWKDAAICLLAHASLKTLSLNFPSRHNLAEHPVLLLTGRLPTVERLSFIGEGKTVFFKFLVTCAFESLREVEIDYVALCDADMQHLRVFLSAHSLEHFTIQGEQNLDQTFDIVRHVRASRFGLSVIHLTPPFAPIIQAVPPSTRTLVVLYSQWNEDIGVAFINEVVASPPPVQAVLLVEPEPGMDHFHWMEDPSSCQDVIYCGRRIMRAAHWARSLAKKGIRLLDQKEKTLQECSPVL